MSLAVCTGNYSTTDLTLPRVLPTTIVAVGGVNPVNTTARVFSKCRGTFTVRITNSNGATIRFTVSGGWGPNPNSTPNPNFWYSPNTAESCTVTFVALNQMSVASTLAAPNNQTYLVTFAAYPTIDPTIIRTAGANVTGDLSVDVLDTVPAGIYAAPGLVPSS